MANQFLIKNSMADMKNLSAAEIAGFQGANPAYLGIELLGYYRVGDLPSSVFYYTSSSSGTDNGGNIIETAGMKFESVYKSEVDIRYFGAKGDGQQDDTQFIQNAIDTGLNVYYPTPSVVYKITQSLRSKTNQIHRGDYQHNRNISAVEQGLVATMAEPVFISGSGTAIVNGKIEFASPRISYITLDRMVIVNRGTGDGVHVLASTNFQAIDCRIRSSAPNAISIYLTYSYRAEVRGCWLGAVGSNSYALLALDNMNGLQVHGNTVSAGRYGTGIAIGLAQNISVQDNILEINGKAIVLGGTDKPNDGSINGYVVSNNYSETASLHLSLGARFGLAAGTVANNFLTTEASGAIPSAEHDSVILIGRVQTTEIRNNYFNQGFVPVFNFMLNNSTSETKDNISEYGNKIVRGASNPLYKLTGDYMSNQGLIAALGGRNLFRSIKSPVEGKGVYGSLEEREYISPIIKANEGFSPGSWIQESLLEFGGLIYVVQIIEKQGDVSGAKLKIGNSVNNNAYVNNLDLGTLTYVNACTTVKDTYQNGGTINPTLLNTLLVEPSTQPTATGTFRIRISYRAT
ncbi:MAG: hypothetical protein ACN6ON_00240 [Sphingobacterium sp.]